MNMDGLRRGGASALIALGCAMLGATAAAAPSRASSAPADAIASQELQIAGFLANLDQNLGNVSRASAVVGTVDTVPGATDSEAPAERRGLLPHEKPTGLRTGLLILAGAVVAMLAAVGLMLSLIAMRKDQRRQQRGRRRRYQTDGLHSNDAATAAGPHGDGQRRV
jgi:hypothetical protein